MAEIVLSDEQQQVLDQVMIRMNECGFHAPRHLRNLFITTVGGYAGTGKTTLLSYLRKEIKKSYPNLSVSFVTFTGKAASVLQSKLSSCYTDVSNDYVGTIHGLIYKPEVKWDRNLKAFIIVGWRLKNVDEIYTDLIIIDEGSMVSSKLWNDLKSLAVPIIVVGDHGQLPPIGDSFNLVQYPDFKLTQIHRQALQSPIIALSQFVRKNGYIPFNRIFSNEVFKLSWNHPKCKNIWENKVTFDENLIVLCGFNSTRQTLNSMIRKRMGYSGNLPCIGERIICLQNDHKRGVMNGQIGTLIWLMPGDHGIYRMTLDVDTYSEPLECAVSNKCFGQVAYTIYDKSEESKKQYNYVVKHGLDPIDYFDYGYAMSIHKSQGSEWEKVILFEQRSKHWDDEYYSRWLYTGITRAKTKLFIISDFWD